MSEKKGSAKVDPHAAKLAELEQKHGRLAHAVTPKGDLLAFRMLDLDEWEDYQEQLAKISRKEKTRGAVFRELAELTCVHPALDELEAHFKLYPALPAMISDAAAELATGGIEFAVKKD